jgi:hypothetical protein
MMQVLEITRNISSHESVKEYSQAGLGGTSTYWGGSKLNSRKSEARTGPGHWNFFPCQKKTCASLTLSAP